MPYYHYQFTLNRYRIRCQKRLPIGVIFNSISIANIRYDVPYCVCGLFISSAVEPSFAANKHHPDCRVSMAAWVSFSNSLCAFLVRGWNSPTATGSVGEMIFSTCQSDISPPSNAVCALYFKDRFYHSLCRSFGLSCKIRVSLYYHSVGLRPAHIHFYLSKEWVTECFAKAESSLPCRAGALLIILTASITFNG